MWKQFRDTRYEVSEDGQVRAIWKTIRLLNTSRGKVHINKKSYTVRRLIAEVFGTTYMHGNSKLTNAQVAEIRLAASINSIQHGEVSNFYIRLAEKYGVSATYIRHIIYGVKRK